jgi:hypothetical protein
VRVVEESVAVLPEYGRVPIAFRVETRFRVEPIRSGLGGLLLVEEPVAAPYVGHELATASAHPLSIGR